MDKILFFLSYQQIKKLGAFQPDETVLETNNAKIVDASKNRVYVNSEDMIYFDSFQIGK